MKISAAFAPTLWLLCVIAAVPVFAQVEVTYLGNEGVLLRSAKSGVLIDVLHGPYLGYAAAPPEMIEEIVTGRSPYQNVDLVLVSHVHRDHFDARLVAEHLKKNPDAILASSDHVANEVRPLLPDESAAKRVYSVAPEPGKTESRSFHGVDVSFLGLPHDGPRPWNELRNLGHIISIGGLKVLHVGDAKMDPAVFAAFQLPRQKIDLALLPGWYLTSSEGQRLVREHVRPRHILAVHVKEDAAAEVSSKVHESFPDAVVLTELGATFRFGPSN